MHARLALGEDVLTPYKAVITQWINPPDPRKPLSVGKAKKAISDYKKALGQPEGLAELTVFYCEQVFDFPEIFGIDDNRFYDALARMLSQALANALALPPAQCALYLARLDAVRDRARVVGWGGVSEDFDDCWIMTGLEDES